MKTQLAIMQLIDRRKFKYLAINTMGLAGIALALAAIVFTQDQAAVIAQLSQELTHSPVNNIITSIKSLF